MVKTINSRIIYEAVRRKKNFPKLLLSHRHRIFKINWSTVSIYSSIWNVSTVMDIDRRFGGAFI